MKHLFCCQIYKMGNKFGTYFSKDTNKSINIGKGELVNFTFIKGKSKKDYITRFANIISFRKDVIKFFNLHKGEKIYFRIKTIPKRDTENYLFFQDGNIDLLKLIPKYAGNGSHIILDSFFKEDEEWLRLWSYHNRGSSQQIEIKRLIDINIFGKFLGQIQSEGTKNGDGKRLEFCNKSVKEHKDFISYLNYFGIPSTKILVKFNYHPDVKNIEYEIKKFEDSTGFKVKYVALNPKSKGNFGFHTFVRSTLLYHIITNSLEIIRRRIVKNKFDKNTRLLADGFLAKIFSGDGNVEIITKNRKTPQGRIKISDGNLNYLEDYKEIMKKYGFKPHINQKQHYVRSYLNTSLAKTLLFIGAFEGNPNKDKLELLIKTNDFATS